jgi:hypothetical protein
MAAPQAAALTTWRRPPWSWNPTPLQRSAFAAISCRRHGSDSVGRFLGILLAKTAHPGLTVSPVATRTLLGLLLAGGATIGLVSTNPGPAEFEEFAGERLTRLVSHELCSQDGLPMLLRLVVRDCTQLIESQRQVLGRLARDHTRRRNFGILSVYTTDLGGQQLLSSWRLPRYNAVTVAAAGRFMLVHSSETVPGELRP